MLNSSRTLKLCLSQCWLVVMLFVVSQSAAADWLDDYASHVKKEASKYNVPGYAFVFYEQGKAPRVYVYGRTQKKGGESVTQDTVFRLASVSKTFTALLSAKLVEKKQLSWETPISTLLPDIPFNGKGMGALQLQHIVGQSSGFMPNAYDNLIEADYSLERVLKSLGELEPLCVPGECYTYQNALFGALEYYFSNNNTSYSRQMQANLFTPLGMNTASVGKGGLLASDSWAHPHIAIARNKWREGKVESNYYRFSPAAGVNASISDMTIYLQALLGEFPTVMSKEMVDFVTTERVRTKRETYRRGWRGMIDDAHYGLGWRIYDINGMKLNYHGGWVKGYRADVAFSPEHKVGYVMLMNAESNMINSTTAELWKRYLKKADAAN
ncbi:serine hydrolase [Alteromonas mediterranea]|uniref:serine hydrolase domain-containing protein n=1 Tax=Alteromonas mediterranea TaxID=314275 RepID=UPI000903E120|nr:serine hydrolase domain-containing protein [Alteromonas mediterranea]APD95660.1 serine hydrolase [Alteromonas mediterranea]APD99293.1 serine hydrolase [Alteromonas mediterranea]QDG40104.1 beta-lactamase family protein [Alteromonas mediterranea]